MNNTPYVLRVTAAFFAVIIFFIYGVFALFNNSEPKMRSEPDYVNIFGGFELTEAAQASASGSGAAVTLPAGSGAMPTGSAGTVLGKIVKRTIPSNGGNLSGGGVHISNSTDLNVDINELLSSKLGFIIEKGGSPQVLIVHTHATETFLNEDRDYYTSGDQTRTTDNSYNVTALGAIIAENLNNAGINTLHDKTQHDYPEYNGSYSRAAKTITAHLKKYPSIKVVIDIHRDSVQTDTTKTKLVADVGGKNAAQIMLVMGSQSGNVKNFPNWKENLKLAVRLQKNIEETYPSLARPLSLMSRSYNEPLTTGSMLIEVGTEANSFAEAVYSAELLANSLIKTLGS